MFSGLWGSILSPYFINCVFLTTPPLPGENEAPSENLPGDWKPSN